MSEKFVPMENLYRKKGALLKFVSYISATWYMQKIVF